MYQQSRKVKLNQVKNLKWGKCSVKRKKNKTHICLHGDERFCWKFILKIKIQARQAMCIYPINKKGWTGGSVPHLTFKSSKERKLRSWLTDKTSKPAKILERHNAYSI